MAVEAEVEAGAFLVVGLRRPTQVKTIVGVAAVGATVRTILDLDHLPVLGHDHILVLVLRHRILPLRIRTRRTGKRRRTI